MLTARRGVSVLVAVAAIGVGFVIGLTARSEGHAPASNAPLERVNPTQLVVDVLGLAPAAGLPQLVVPTRPARARRPSSAAAPSGGAPSPSPSPAPLQAPQPPPAHHNAPSGSGGGGGEV